MIVLIDEMSSSETCAQTTGRFAVTARVTSRWSRNERIWTQFKSRRHDLKSNQLVALIRGGLFLVE